MQLLLVDNYFKFCVISRKKVLCEFRVLLINWHAKVNIVRRILRSKLNLDLGFMLLFRLTKHSTLHFTEKRTEPRKS